MQAWPREPFRSVSFYRGTEKTFCRINCKRNDRQPYQKKKQRNQEETRVALSPTARGAATTNLEDFLPERSVNESRWGTDAHDVKRRRRKYWRSTRKSGMEWE